MRMLTAAAVLAVASSAAAQDSRRAEVVRKLETMRVSLDFQEAPVGDVANALADLTGLNFVPDPEALASGAKVTFKVRDLVLKSALKLMLASVDLTAAYRDGVIVLQPRGSGARAMVVRVHDVRDILFPIQDFPGPRLELRPDQPGIGLSMTIDEPRSTFNEELIVELVRASTGDGSWEAGGAEISPMHGLLVVNQSRRVHDEIARLIDRLRRFK